MIFKDIKIFSQNVWKNNLIVNTILESKFSFDVIFVQELSWTIIHSIPSSKSEEGEELVRVSNHPNWLNFARNSTSNNNSPQVITYVNIRMVSFRFSFHKDILSHRDISLISFFNNNDVFYLMDVYSDSFQTALKYLKDMKANI